MRFNSCCCDSCLSADDPDRFVQEVQARLRREFDITATCFCGQCMHQHCAYDNHNPQWSPGDRDSLYHDASEAISLLIRLRGEAERRAERAEAAARSTMIERLAARWCAWIRSIEGP